MIASAANGFMNTSITDCSGTPFNFQPEYNSARAQNLIPWGFGPYMINSQFEIGHFEPCASLVNPVTDTGDTFYTNCVGLYDSSAENSALEPDDAPCYPFGDTHGGTAAPNLSETINQLQGLPVPLGWTPQLLQRTEPSAWAFSLAGWLVTGFAISLGAPFWFDLLQNLMNINVRGAGPKPLSTSGSQTS